MNRNLVNYSEKNEDHSYLIKQGSCWIIFIILFLSIVLFGISGTFSWYNGWIFIITLSTTVMINLITLFKINPELLEERIHIHKGSKKWDIIIMTIATAVITGTLVTAALDKKYELSQMDDRMIFAGILLFILGDSIILWSMIVNKWFSKLVRIQTDRGQKVVDSGPYSFVRHPGYLGWIFINFGIPLILGSLLSVIPASISLILILIRTQLEDNTLKNELNGYMDYTFRTRYRLIPGIW